MKIFLKNQSTYVVSIIISVFLVLGIVWLDGYRDITLLLYGLFLSLLSSGLFLLMTWLRQRRLYQVINSQEKRVNFEVIQEDSAQLSKEVYGLLNQQHLIDYQELKEHKNALDEHQTFMYQWVHQMKTPISVIELMVEGHSVSHESLLEETDRIKEGLDLALNMARLETFSNDFIIEQVNLKQLVIQVINEQKRPLIRNQIYPKIEINEEFVVETDRKWLAFCLTQLLLNSIKYTELEENRLLIKANCINNQLNLSIQDFGIGIDSADLPRIFQPFYTGKTGRKNREATGMGLYLVDKVCRQLNHTVSIDSELGVGTRVTIEF